MGIMNKNFDYEIVDHIATLNITADEQYTLEVNSISYNGEPPKLDIRRWDKRYEKRRFTFGKKYFGTYHAGDRRLKICSRGSGG